MILALDVHYREIEAIAVGVLLHWDGHAWSSMASSTSKHLYSIAMTSPDDGWAVGDVILHWDGRSWSPAPGPFLGYQFSVTASSGDGWIAGAEGILLRASGPPPPPPLEGHWQVTCVDCPTPVIQEVAERAFRIDNRDRLHVAFGGDHLLYGFSDGGPWTFSVADRSPGVGAYAALAVDGEDRPHISYYDAVNQHLKYATLESTGWRVEFVDPQVTQDGNTSIAVDSTGRPHIAYDLDGGSHYAYRDPTGWHRETIPQCFGGQQVVVDASNRPHVACGSTTELRYGWRDQQGWTMETVPVLSAVGLSLFMDQTDTPHLSSTYLGSGWQSNLGYAYRDQQGWHVQTIDIGPGGAGSTSIALDPADFPRISFHYLDSSNAGDLMYVYQDPQGWHTETIYPWGAAPELSSLAVDSNGTAHVVFFGYGSGSLQYARRDPSGWQETTISSSQDVGQYNTLDLDASSYPHIAYGDMALRVMKYAFQDASGWHASVLDSSWSPDASGLDVDRSGRPHIVYLNAVDPLRYATLAAGGWIGETLPAGLQGPCRLIVDWYGRVHVQCYRGYAYRDATGWHESACGAGDALAVDANGYPHALNARLSDDCAENSWYELDYDHGEYSGCGHEIVERGYECCTFEDLQVAVDEAGNLHMANARSCLPAYRYGVRNEMGWTFQRFANNEGWVSLLRLDTRQQPHIYFFLPDSRHALEPLTHLVHAYRVSTGWQYRTWPLPEPVSAPSLAINVDGQPVISYYDATTGDLKLAAFFPEIRPKQAFSGHAAASPAIDGDLADWPELAAVTLSPFTASTAGGTIDGSLDASASCRFQWDEARVFAGCLVLDDAPLAPDSGSAFWHDDTLEVVFDGLNDDRWGADDHKLEVHVDGSMTDDGAVANPTIQVGVAAYAGNYVVELAVPWALLGGPRGAGQSLGLNLGLIDDDDGGESEGWLVWSGQTTYQRPGDCGDLLLLAGAATPTPVAATATATPSPTPTATPGSTPSATATRTPTVPSNAPTPTGTSTPAPTATPFDTPSPTATATPVQSGLYLPLILRQEGNGRRWLYLPEIYKP